MRECFLSWTRVSLAAGHKLHIVLTTVPENLELGWFGLERGPIEMLPNKHVTDCVYIARIH